MRVFIPIADNAPEEPLHFDVSKRIPKFGGDVAWVKRSDRFYRTNAKTFVEAFLKYVPQAFADAVLVELLCRHASLLRVVITPWDARQNQ